MRLPSEDEWICNAELYFDLVLVGSCDFYLGLACVEHPGAEHLA
jgi:hypothetical protein